MPRDMEKKRAWYRKRYQTKVKPKRLAVYAENKDNGICVNCGCRPALEGILLCDPCKETRRLVSNRYNANIRNQVFKAYGGERCACCGETEPFFLCIDHINGDGAAHRRQLKTQKGTRTSLYSWLINNNFPPGFQVLCQNCNFGKYRNKGLCPHQAKKNHGSPDG